jgi:hypothetical protein
MKISKNLIKKGNSGEFSFSTIFFLYKYSEQNINSTTSHFSEDIMMAEKELQNLQELIRSATNQLLTDEEKVGYVMNPELKKRLYGKFPECFICVKRLGRDTSTYLLPLCNRAGIVDPIAINISYKMVGKLLSDKSGAFDVNELQSVLDKLTRMKERYEKDVPKPPQQSGRKAMVTRMFNNIKGHLKTIQPKE